MRNLKLWLFSVPIVLAACVLFGASVHAQTYTGRTDLTAAPETVPSECSPAPCTMTSSDLNANVKYTRVTDGNTDPAHTGSSYATDGSSEQLIWNSTSSMFYFGGLDSGAGMPFSLNTSTGITTRIPCTFAASDCSSNTYGGLIFLTVSDSSDIPYSMNFAVCRLRLQWLATEKGGLYGDGLESRDRRHRNHADRRCELSEHPDHQPNHY